MKHIKKFENFSTEYYNEFDMSKLPKKIKFDDPNMTFDFVEAVPGSNKVLVRYVMSSKQPNSKNPYTGDMPEEMTIDIGMTYKEENTKIYVTIVGGNRVWWNFSYEKGIVKDIEKSNVKISRKSTNSIKTFLKKYSSQTLGKF